MELLLNKAVSGSDIQKLLDIPVGTGRFFELYDSLGIEVIGADVSEDMISKSREKVDNEIQSTNVSFQHGDILDRSTIDIGPDIVVCIRLLNWFSFDEVREAIINIDGIDAEYAIVGIRTQSDEEIGLKKRLWLLQAQIISRLSNREITNNNSINIHPESGFKQLIQEKFKIEHRVLVDVGTSPKKFGSEYCIYLLKSIN